MNSSPSFVIDKPWKERLDIVLEMMREMSIHTDPQAMVKAYAEKVGQILHVDYRLSLSRRDLQNPHVKITRSTSNRWNKDLNPWKDKDKLPMIQGGVLADWIYSNKTIFEQDFHADPSDPAFEHLEGFRSVLAIPQFDQGEAYNMVVLFKKEPNMIPVEQVPELVWQSNLFGRATHNLVMREELRQAYESLDLEMKVVAEIQRSLLPKELPKIPTLDLASYYQPASRAGGDYYDFFPLPDDQWGLFIADVSGHGTPSAVVMAVTHCIAHTHPGAPAPPGRVLGYINDHLCRKYTESNSTFVTAFYAIFDPKKKTLTYANAGHNPPRLKRCNTGKLLELNRVGGLPLGIDGEEIYSEVLHQLEPGDQIIFYTDGITEAHNPGGQMFGTKRMDEVLENCTVHAQGLLNRLLESLAAFVETKPADDDRTVVVARVR